MDYIYIPKDDHTAAKCIDLCLDLSDDIWTASEPGPDVPRGIYRWCRKDYLGQTLFVFGDGHRYIFSPLDTEPETILDADGIFQTVGTMASKINKGRGK